MESLAGEWLHVEYRSEERKVTGDTTFPQRRRRWGEQRPQRCFTPDVARQIAALRADPGLQARLDDLANKANEGELTQHDREQYEAYVEAIDLISILQAKARKILDDNTTA